MIFLNIDSYCVTCNIYCNSNRQLAEHLNGNQHARKLRLTSAPETNGDQTDLPRNQPLVSTSTPSRPNALVPRNKAAWNQCLWLLNNITDHEDLTHVHLALNILQELIILDQTMGRIPNLTREENHNVYVLFWECCLRIRFFPNVYEVQNSCYQFNIRGQFAINSFPSKKMTLDLSE